MKLRLSMLCVASVCCFGLAALVWQYHSDSPILGFILGGVTAAASLSIWTWNQ